MRNYDRRSRFMGLAMLAALVLQSPHSSHAAMGGQDLEITHIQSADGLPEDLHFAIASDGTAFVAFSIYDDVLNQWQIQVHRSVNGGKTWSEWGAPLLHRVVGLDATIAPGNPEQIVLAYSDFDAPGCTGSIQLDRADIGSATPVWQNVVVGCATAPAAAQRPHVSAIAGPGGGPARIALLWFVYATSYAEVTYAYSSTGGTSFSAPITLASAPLGGIYNLDIAMDAGNVVQGVWVYDDMQGGTKQFYYRRATGGGDSDSEWSSPVLLGTLDPDASVDVSVATSPVSGGVIATVGESEYPTSDKVYLHISTDAGLTWPHPVKTFDGKRNPVAFWGDSGPLFSAVNVTDLGSFPIEIVRPLGNLLDFWTAQGMLFPSYTFSYSGMPATDPSRDGEIAMVALMENLEDNGVSPWFDAEWRAEPGWGVPEFEPGHYIDFGDISSAPGISDLDNDGDREVILTTNDPAWIVRFDLELERSTYIISTDPTSPASAPAMIDVDGNGTNEIFVGVDTGKILGIRENGGDVTGFPVDTGSGQPTWVSCSRITGSAWAEIVGATANSIFVYEPWSSVAPGFPYTAAPARGNVVGRVAIGDVDDDGDVELVAAFEHGVLVLSKQGVLENSFFLGGPSISAGVSLADMNGDGDLEIAVPRANGSVGLVHHDGTTFGPAWPWNSGTGQPIGSVAIADYFGGNDPEIIFAAKSGEVFAVDLNGAQPSGWAFAVGASAEDAPEPIVSGLGDVGKQIALGDLDSKGYVRRPLGPQAGWPRSFYGAIEHAAAAADLDNDGNVELVIPAGHRLWILDMGVSDGAVNSNWPMAGARASRSGCRECEIYWGTGAEELASTPSVRAVLHPGEPNPFQESTLIRYDVPALGAQVRLDIYDVMGRLVRTLVQEPQQGGAHSMRWDARNSSGGFVSAGVYLVRLSAGAETRTTQVVRLK